MLNCFYKIEQSVLAKTWTLIYNPTQTFIGCISNEKGNDWNKIYEEISIMIDHLNSAFT